MSCEHQHDPLLESCYQALKGERDAQAHQRKTQQAQQDATQACYDSQEQTRVALITYTQTSCRVLCEKMHSTLPREIRDEVYQHLIPHWPINSYYVDRITTSRLEFRPKLQHLIDEKCMRSDCIREIQEEYFRTSKFYFAKCHMITGFCIEDPLNLGLLARDQCLDVEVAFACEDYRFPDANDDGDSTWDRWNYDSTKILASLEPLFCFKQGSKITLHIAVDEGQIWEGLSVWQWLWDVVIPYIFPTLRKLSLSGRNITVRLQGEPYKLEAYDRSFLVKDWEDYLDEMQEKAAEEQEIRDRAAALEKLKRDDEERYFGVEDLFSSSQD